MIPKEREKNSIKKKKKRNTHKKYYQLALEIDNNGSAFRQWKFVPKLYKKPESVNYNGNG